MRPGLAWSAHECTAAVYPSFRQGSGNTERGPHGPLDEDLACRHMPQAKLLSSTLCQVEMQDLLSDLHRSTYRAFIRVVAASGA